MKKIHWRTLTKAKADGYSYASMNISSRLRAHGVLGLEDYSYSNTFSLAVSELDGIRLIPEPEGMDIVVNNCLPTDYSYEQEYVIGFTYWETTLLPPSWVEAMNKCNEIWTTSSWAVDVFLNSGVEVPVYGFDLGVDTDIFSFYKRNIETKPFTFIHVGSPSTRKNTQLVVDAFLKMFKGNNDYKLIIKSNGQPDARIFMDGENKGGIYNVPNIEVIDYYLSDQELSELFRKSHCMVYPTRGEGWGMSPFQAISTGLPTICTNRTACSEFAHLSVPLEAEMSRAYQFGIYENGDWANPKIDDVCDKMLYVINNYDAVLEKTEHGSNYIYSRYSWDNIVLPYKQRLMELQ
jgi:glycosyltransferase involved in cell wall biosynthesis